MMKWIAATLAALLCFPALAADRPKTLDDLFGPLQSGGCVTIDSVRAIAPVIELTDRQFDFARGFWMAVPPQSDTLPPGDKAFLADSGSPDDEALGLYDSSDGSVCAVVHAPAWLRGVLERIGRGETGKRGNPT